MGILTDTGDSGDGDIDAATTLMLMILIRSQTLVSAKDKLTRCIVVLVAADEEYVRKQLRHSPEHGQTTHDDESLKSLRWDAAVLRKVC